MQPLISLKKITKHYFIDKIAQVALKEVALEIHRGEMVAIVGVSGSGKSTLMNIMGLLDDATSGEYILDGQNVANLSSDQMAELRNHKIGFVFQSFFLLTKLTALENVMLPLSYRDTTRSQAKAAALSMLGKMQVAHFAHHKPNQLSGGQQQRVAIARALVTQPDLILADEPTGALDSQTSDDVMGLLTDLNRQHGHTIVIITHDKAISERCQRVITIKDGQILIQ